MNNACIFLYDRVTHDIITMQRSSNYSQSAIWADTDIGLRLVVKATSQSVRICSISRQNYCFWECNGSLGMQICKCLISN